MNPEIRKLIEEIADHAAQMAAVCRGRDALSLHDFAGIESKIAKLGAMMQPKDLDRRRS